MNGFTVGDRVTYTGSPLGAYSTERVMPIGSLFKLPDDIELRDRGGDDHARPERRLLAAEDQPVDEGGDTILLHAAAGGVGLIASQWAKLLGLRVIGTVSTEAKAELAKAHGCDEIIFYRREDVADARQAS